MGEAVFSVGASIVPITIPESFFPYRSFKGRFFTGLHDDIYVRAILMEKGEEKALILSIELGDFGHIGQWQKRIQEILPIPQDSIFITVTHNHPAPHVCDDWDQEVVDEEKTAWFGELVWEAMKKSVTEAREKLQPAKMSIGSGTCDINTNRDPFPRAKTILGGNPHGLSDKTVEVIRFDDLEGNPLAFLINYSVHGSVMMGVAVKDGGMLVTGDLPGYTSQYVEEAYDNKVVALWTSGAAADQDPKYPAKRMRRINGESVVTFDAGEAGYVLVQVMAESLADEVLYVASELERETETGAIRCLQKDYQVEGKVNIHAAPECLDGFSYEDAPPFAMHLSMLTVGKVAMVGIPGELVCSIGQDVKKALGQEFEKVIVITHCNGSISYISDIDGFSKFTPESARSHVKCGWAEKVIVGGAREMAQSLTIEKR